MPWVSANNFHTTPLRALDINDIKKEIAKKSPEASEFVKFSRSQFSPSQSKLQQDQIMLEEESEPMGKDQYIGMAIAFGLAAFVAYNIWFGEYNLDIEEGLAKSLGTEYVEHMQNVDPQYAEKIAKLQERRRQSKQS